MSVSYLTSISTAQPHAAKDLFESKLRFPELTAEQLATFIENAERLILQEQRIKLSINGTVLPLAEMARNSNDREGAVILKGIADALPRAFRDHADPQLRDLAFYEAAGLIASPAFWQATEDALRMTVNRDATSGDIRLDNASQLGMNVTLSKDGKNLECHLSASWREFTARGEWHALTGLDPAMKAAVRMLIPLERKSDGHEVQANIFYLDVNSPVPAIVSKLKERQTTLPQDLLNALASIPLLGRLFRGVQIKVRVGENFPDRGIAYIPANLSDRPWVGTGHTRHVEDHLAKCTHITAKRLTRGPNATRPLTRAMMSPPANSNQVAPLKVLLDHRPPELRSKVNIVEGMDYPALQGGGNPEAPDGIGRHLDDIPPPPPEIPPIGPTVTDLQLQVQTLQQSLEAERQARQATDTERDALNTEIQGLRQQLEAGVQERAILSEKLDIAHANYGKAHTAAVAAHSPHFVTMPPTVEASNAAQGGSNRAHSLSASRHTRLTAARAGSTTTTTTTDDNGK